jgi:hypothetical protein
MKSLTLIAAAALVSTALAAPAMARGYCDHHRCYHRGPVNPVGAAVGTATGIAGAAIGTAGAIAAAPFGGSYNAYGPYGADPYSDPNFACRPGTWIKGTDGRRHICQ